MLVGDIGATNARFAMLRDAQIAVTETYAVANYPTPADAIRSFLNGPAREHQPSHAALAVAGPVVDGHVRMTNAAWTVDGPELQQALGLTSVQVLNDFAAVAWALPDLTPADFHVLGAPQPGRPGTRVAMGPGTGFGCAAFASGPMGEAILVTEGGHATLAATDTREAAIIEQLRQRFPHVSVERVLSGPGMVDLYHAITTLDRLSAPDRDGAEIVAHALAGDCEASHRTLATFCAILGSVAGNIALTLGATGGVFISGGIAPRFLGFLDQSAFRSRFEAKGRFAGYLAAIPTVVITHKYPAFVGLARAIRVARQRGATKALQPPG